MKKILSLVLVLSLALVGLVLPACAEEKEAPLELSLMAPIYENMPDINNEWFTYYYEQTNTKWELDFIPSNDYDTKFDLVLASGDMPDLMTGTDQARPTLISAIKNGAFHNLSNVLGDFSNYPNLRDNPTPGSWDYVKVDGSIWGIPRSRPQIDLGIKYRKDWADKLGLELPKTLDEYKDFLYTICTSDPDGNGLDDTLGIVGSGFFMNDSDSLFMNAFGCYNLDANEEGGLYYPYLTDGYIDYVDYFREFYELGLISKEFSVMKKTQAEELYVTGRAVSYTRNIWRDYKYTQDLIKAQPEGEIDTLPTMEGPNGNTAWLAKGMFGAFYINARMDEEKLMRTMDFFEQVCTEEWLINNYFGVEGVHYTVVDGGRELTDLGREQIGTTINNMGPLTKNTWAKVLCPAAPAAYNDEKIARMDEYFKDGQINNFEVLVSDTWTSIWPKYENEFKSNTIKAIVGQISMDEYRAYVEALRAQDDMKQAFQEFAAANQAMFG